jgi:hypothetical protein
VAGRFAIATRLGYLTRQGVPAANETRGPWLIRAVVRWQHRNAVYIPWNDIITITDQNILVLSTSDQDS